MQIIFEKIINHKWYFVETNELPVKLSTRRLLISRSNTSNRKTRKTENMTDNTTLTSTTLVSCGSDPYLGLPIPERLSPELRAIFIFRIAVNATTVVS